MKQQGQSKSEDLAKAASILKSGGVVIFPTDTVYGIGCRYDLPKAVDRVHAIKNTPKSQSFPILVSSKGQTKGLVKINSTAGKLIDIYWPGALTIILESKKGDQKIGVRLPASATTTELIKLTGTPIIGTSANIHGRGAVKTSEELDPDLTKQVDFILEGEAEGGLESTVVDATVSPPKIIRQGAVQIS